MIEAVPKRQLGYALVGLGPSLGCTPRPSAGFLGPDSWWSTIMCLRRLARWANVGVCSGQLAVIICWRVLTLTWCPSALHQGHAPAWRRLALVSANVPL